MDKKTKVKIRIQVEIIDQSGLHLANGFAELDGLTIDQVELRPIESLYFDMGVAWWNTMHNLAIGEAENG